MHNEADFRQFLKRSGKKEHVIDGLVEQVRDFETFLMENRQTELDRAGDEDFAAYLETLPPDRVKVRVRGLALYYKSLGNLPLARRISAAREQETAKTRKVFKLRDFRGVDMEAVAKMETLGIANVGDILAAGKTPQDRRQLADKTGATLEAILELVKLADISRLGAIKAVRARLYYDAGLDTPDKFTQWEPEALREYLVEWVARTGFDGIAPLPKEIRNAIAAAKSLPRLVDYEPS